MNVGYENCSASDLGKLIGVDGGTIRLYCRQGLINATNVSDGTTNARWLIPDSEVDRVIGIIDDKGKRNLGKQLRFMKAQSETESVVEPEVEDKPEDAVIGGVNITKIADLSYKIADIKEELANIEARKNQLENELDSLKETVLKVYGF